MCKDALRNQLIGALIGIARAADGNEHLITPSVTAVVMDSLAATCPGRDMDDKFLAELLDRAKEQKRNMVPDCFLCANPCGRTSDFDLRMLQNADADVREIKLRLMQGLQRIAYDAPKDPSVFYKALVVIGMEDYTVEDLLPILREVDAIA